MSFLKNMFGSNEEKQSVSKVGWRPLTDLGQLNEIIDLSTEKPILIFKHSTRCSISRMVLKQFENEFDLNELTALLAQAPGVVVQQDDAAQFYPMPLWAHEKDDVFVGRLRRDETQAKTLNMWIVSDNLRKGAATNAVQIAAYLVSKGIV